MNINTNTNQYMMPIKRIFLEPGQELNVEPGSMHACKNVEVTTALNGSVWNVVKHYFLGGESVLINTYKATETGAWVALEEGYKGQVAGHQLSPRETLCLQPGSYVASDKNVKIETRFAGFSFFFKGLGLWKINASVPEGEQGRVFFDTKHGIIKAIKVAKEDGIVVIDNESIVGYTDQLSLDLKTLGPVKTTLFSGEGLVNEVTGDGTVFVGTTTAKEDKENVIETAVKECISTLTDGKISAVTIVIFAAVAIVVSSRAFNGGESLNTHKFAKEIVGGLF